MQGGTARHLARWSLLPFVIAALVITGLLGMHALSAPLTTAAADSAVAAEGHAAHTGSDTAAVELDASTVSVPGHDHGCPGDDTGAGKTIVCGMLLPAGTALAAAADPDAPTLTSSAPPVVPGLAVRGIGEPRPSLWELSISRT